MTRQRIIRRATPIFTHYKEDNYSSSIKTDVNNIKKDDNDNNNDNIVTPKSSENNVVSINNTVNKIVTLNKVISTNKIVKPNTIQLGSIGPIKYNNKKNQKYNKKVSTKQFVKYNFNEPKLEAKFETPKLPVEVKQPAGEGEYELFKEVFDIETSNDRHTFIANNMLVHNSVYVSFDPLFKAMTEESQKKFDTDEKKLKFIEDFSRDFLNKQNNEWCENLYNPRHGHSYHEFELESIQKSQLVDKKKKYIKGVVWMKGKTYAEPHMSATGIEIVKSTTPKLCRSILTDLIRDMMFNSVKYDNMNDYCVYFNEILATKKKEFFAAPFQDISNSVSIGDYKKYVIDDQDKLILAEKCPVSVKAISLFNHLAHKHGQDNLRMTSGKIKYYYIKTGPKATDIDYFGYPAGMDEPWFPPCNRTICWDKNIITPMNRFALVIHMPLLNANGEYSLSLF